MHAELARGAGIHDHFVGPFRSASLPLTSVTRSTVEYSPSRLPPMVGGDAPGTRRRSSGTNGVMLGSTIVKSATRLTSGSLLIFATASAL